MGSTQYYFDAWRTAGEALIASTIGLRDRLHLDEAMVALQQARTDAVARGGDTPQNRLRDGSVHLQMAQVHGLRGEWARCRSSANAGLAVLPRTADRTTNPLETTNANLSEASNMAAIAAANLGLWPEAWRHLQQARVRLPLNAADPPLAPGCFDHVDAIVALVASELGSQLWVSTRESGLRGSTRIDLPQLTQFDLGRFMRFGGPGASVCPGWSELVTCKKDSSSPRGSTPQFFNAVSNLTRLTAPLFGPSLGDAFARAGANGAQRVAWAPDATLSQLPVEAIPAVTLNGAAVTTAHALGPFARRSRPGEDRITSVRVVPIAGGDSDIPLAALERRVIERLAPSSRGGQTALHVATHSGFDGESVKIQIAPGQLISVAGLASTPYWRPRPRLVILASCESNFDYLSIINSERIQSPAQELIDLGVGGVIATLWPVQDAVAFLFSTSLHQRMSVDGVSPLSAFGATKSWLRTAERAEFARFANKLAADGLIGRADVDSVLTAIDAAGSGAHPFAHPHYWANLVYWGV